MVIVLLYRVTFQASYNGSHFELGITTHVSMRKMIPEPTNQTKVSLVVRIHIPILAGKDVTLITMSPRSVL